MEPYEEPRRQRLWARRRLLAVVGLAGLGCACAPRIDDDLRVPRTPAFQLTDLRLEPPQRGLGTARAELRIDNPNAWPIVVKSLRYQLVVNGTLLGESAIGLDTRVPARGQAMVTLVLPHPPHPAITALATRPPPRGLSYRLTGEAKVLGTGLDLVPLRLEGVRRTA